MDYDDIKKILYITLSNLGDAVMALPAFDFLRRACPSAKITVVAAPRSKCIFENHPDVDMLIVFDKHAPVKDKIDLFFKLRRERFDCVVDLKDTLFRWGVRAPYKNPARIQFPSWVEHDSARHLYKAAAALRGFPVAEDEFLALNSRRNPSFITKKDADRVTDLLALGRIGPREEFVLIVPGARSAIKKWHKKGYVDVIREIRRRYGLKVVLAGDRLDEVLVGEIAQEAEEEVVNAAGKTGFGELASLVRRARLVIGSDSGVLQIASYLDRPIVGIYGPTDHRRYGPWSRRGIAVRKNVLCAPCSQARCSRDHACIQTITPYDVMLAVRLMLEGKERGAFEDKYRRILVARTDRIGDCLLTTPAFKALRLHYPMSFIAAMVSPAAKDIVDGNPYVDRVIVFDKDRAQSGFLSTLAFSRKLKEMDFDVALILHPTLRVHLVCFLAGIRERIGYDWKAPYFLTEIVPHRKQKGEKHESEYNFEILERIGIGEVPRELYMPIRQTSEYYVQGLFERCGITLEDRVVAVNPAASCISKRWPLDRFAEVIDALALEEGVKVIVVAASEHQALSSRLLSLTKTKPCNLTGKCDISQLASLLKRCRLLISNDSGPVHIAVAVGTPVIDIFGRNQPGLGPLRWGPLGMFDVVLHKKMECTPCLAHDCTQGFKCLSAISVQEVLQHARRLLAAK